MKQAQKISDAEMEVMRAIWKAGEPVTSGQALLRQSLHRLSPADGEGSLPNGKGGPGVPVCPADD